MFQKINNSITTFLQFWWRQPRRQISLSPSEARSVQRRACQYVNNASDQALTPPYVLIAAELSHPEQLVFEAAVYYLCTIAFYETRYQKPIIDILNTYKKDHANLSTRVQYLTQTMKKYNLS